ncbi:MAG: acyl-CoA-binding protein [Cytophagales bacterium]|nr:acyl-CoA-binding protein [Cytophagales bacterium]
MSLEEKFKQAVEQSKELAQKPSNEVLLKIYALYKQATEGDVQGEKPGGFDFKAAAKYNAWESLKGKSPDEAMRDYITLIDELLR